MNPFPGFWHSRWRSLVPAMVVASISFAVVSTAAPRRPLLAYWAFNCTTTCGDANFIPETVSQSPASMSSTFEPDAGSNESGTTLNSVPPYEARAALTLRTGAGGINNGRDLTWRVSTSGFSGIQISFATSRSAGGFASNQFQYTLDGTTFVNFGEPFDPGSESAVVSYDLRHIRGVNSNPNAGFRIVFNGGSTSNATEFILIDNLQVVAR
jgi:hypothetical protein